MLELFEWVAGATLVLVGFLWFCLCVLQDLVMLCIDPALATVFLAGIPAVLLYSLWTGARFFWETDVKWFRGNRVHKALVILATLLIVAVVAYLVLPWYLSVWSQVKFPSHHEILDLEANRLQTLVISHTGRSLDELTSESQGMELSAFVYLFEAVSENYYYEWGMQTSLLEFRWLTAIAITLFEMIWFGTIPFIGGKLSRKKKDSN